MTHDERGEQTKESLRREIAEREKRLCYVEDCPNQRERNMLYCEQHMYLQEPEY